MLINCPECGNEISDVALCCPRCGYAVEKKKFCKFCGEKIPEDSVVCPKCGRMVEKDLKEDGITINNVSNANASSAANNTDNSVHKPLKKVKREVALIICILLGWCGGHKFYEGKVGMGILYLFTFGLFGIGWIVDIVLIAMKPEHYYV